MPCRLPGLFLLDGDVPDQTPVGLMHRLRTADDGLVRLPSLPFSPPADLRSLVRRLMLALGSAATLSAALLFAATPAGAAVQEVEVQAGKKVNFGLQPRNAAYVLDGNGVHAASFANPSGRPVLHGASSTYAIYWDPQNLHDGDWQHLVDGFFANFGSAGGQLSNVFAADAQYIDGTGQPATDKSTFHGSYTDTNPYPLATECEDPQALLFGQVTCITDARVRTQLETFISQHGLPRGMGTIYYLLTPPGVTVCLQKEAEGVKANHCSDHTGAIAESEAEEAANESYRNSFCSYHSAITSTGAESETGGKNTILYAMVPWTAGGLGNFDVFPQNPAYDCQDGGFDPASEPTIEKKEKAKEKKIESKKEEEEHPKNEEEKKEQEKKEQETKALEGPHQQEPNQAKGRDTDGDYDQGLADLTASQIAVEQQNIVTDPMLNAWQQQEPVGSTHNELTDECRNFFADGQVNGSSGGKPHTFAGELSNQSLNGGSYYLNTAFVLSAYKLSYPGIPCVGGVNLVPQFTAPNPVNAGETVGFDGMESDVTLNWTGLTLESSTPKYATYKWNFGDGSPEVTGFAPGAPSLNSPETSPCEAPWKAPCAASTFHSYQYGGTYEVTLTVIDTGGNTAGVTQPITVNGPARPVPPPPPSPSPSPGSSGASATSGSGSSSSSTGAATTKPVLPAPVATQSVLSSSLSKTLRGGLVVRYSVNEQVTGRFEVLLAASIAHRLGLHPPLATGLPAGTPAQVVIGKALLVTTKGGRNTIKIQFGKVTAARLRRLHKVPLMLRLILRNGSAVTTTVLSKLTLTH